ncbi:MAG: AIR synthase related protein [Steroidobacteraceae bacterium]
MAVNDLVTVGAAPISIHAYWAAGGSDWFSDVPRMEDLVGGWQAACDVCEVSWGGGETPALAGVVAPGSIDLAAACVGIVPSRAHLTLGAPIARRGCHRAVGRQWYSRQRRKPRAQAQ